VFDRWVRDHEDRLARLANGERSLTDVDVSTLDAATRSLVRVGALVASNAGAASYRADVERALAAGATPEQLVDALVAVGPVVGLARVVSAAPRLASALGHDVDEALECIDAAKWSR
jgi:alkylhydroperoxidase/carboxymuconolactone decarboxylase family protein YurZ